MKIILKIVIFMLLLTSCTQNDIEKSNTISDIYILQEKNIDSNIKTHALITSAKKQIWGVIKYDTSYYKWWYPPKDRGACTDVIEQALRDNWYFLKDEIDKDMLKYPKNYSNSYDKNINFRRVKNVKIFLDNYAEKFSTCIDENCFKSWIWQPWNIVTFDQIPWSLWHIAIISNKTNLSEIPLLIHNYWVWVIENDMLLNWPTNISWHYRIDNLIWKK